MPSPHDLPRPPDLRRPRDLPGLHDLPSPDDLPESLVLAPFHVREALAERVGRARLRRKDLVAPYRGIRSLSPVGTALERCRAYLPLLRPQQCFSHATAAQLWGIWLPARLRASPVVHVTSPHPLREPRMRGVRGHRVGAGSVDVGMLAALPLTSPIDTWRQLAETLTLDELVEAGDSLVRRKDPLAALDHLPIAVSRHAGRRGAATLARALPWVRAGCDSPRETRLRLLLVRSGLPEPLVNLEVSPPGAGSRRFGDLVYPRWRVIVEYDGRQHLDPRQRARDILRLEELAAQGWTVITVLAEHFGAPGAIVRRVARALAAHGWRPPRSRLQLLHPDA